MADRSIAERLHENSILKSCGTSAMDALSLGEFSRQAERERLELQLQLAFPEDWQTLLDVMDRFDRASTSELSLYIKQMWAVGVCRPEEVIALYERCPAAFRDHHPLSVIGQSPPNILPKMAEALP